MCTRKIAFKKIWTYTVTGQGNIAKQTDAIRVRVLDLDEKMNCLICKTKLGFEQSNAENIYQTQ